MSNSNGDGEFWSDFLRRRFFSPFMSSLLLAWPIINYQFLLSVFGDGDFDHKIYYITTFIFPSPLEKALYFVFFPILAAAAYTIFLPVVDGFLSLQYERINNKNNRLLMEERGKSPISDEDKQNIISHHQRDVNARDERNRELGIEVERQKERRAAESSVLLGALRWSALSLIGQQLRLPKEAISSIEQFGFSDVASEVVMKNIDVLANHPRIYEFIEVVRYMDEKASSSITGVKLISPDDLGRMGLDRAFFNDILTLFFALNCVQSLEDAADQVWRIAGSGDLALCCDRLRRIYFIR